jgi:hypothetical protein
MFGPFVHNIDPVVASIAGVHVWWYGLSYAAGFLSMLSYMLHVRHRLGLSRAEVYALVSYVAIGTLAGGRLIEVCFDEWPFYREHPELIPAYCLGGMATHGLLLGAAGGLVFFSDRYRKPLLEIADALVIPGAFLDDHRQQLDARRACSLRETTSGSSALLAISGDRHCSARPVGARSVRNAGSTIQPLL